MSAYKWLAFAVGIPIAAALIAITRTFTTPAVDMMDAYSTSQYSAEGISMYQTALTWLPLIVLALLAFMVIVAIIVRRRSVVR